MFKANKPLALGRELDVFNGTELKIGIKFHQITGKLHDDTECWTEDIGSS